MISKQEKRKIRHKRILNKVVNPNKPRLFVFKSNKHIYAYLIDDNKKKILFSVNDNNISEKKDSSKKEDNLRTGKILKSYLVGKLIAQKAIENKIKEIVFDRGGYKYHGRVKALAEGAREGGLKF
ncbi:MAG TPA: 50S ribosomal protein L18 [Candidatus Pacearchaeota archaeon]|nr:50S ribosomal protein L18 [Candidatus Paceibacterota bacterium]HOK00530.1 50S ribosomal protein L18 [Candidatus Pacearchaeota archaeon]HOL90343.1 50S ribosomal protein L18 [Candidatus Pacearchaeota archaeon]